MTALIDRDATLERMKSMAGCATCDNYNYVRCRACSWDDAMNIVEEMSEIEAVPVVRCRDCKNYNTNGCSAGFGWCEDSVVNAGVSDDFYCANGERRDDDAVD